MAIAKIHTISSDNKLTTYIDTRINPSVKYISIYDDKHDNSLAFNLTDVEMKEWAEFMLKFLENK
ncbi:MAG: hypothetical protein EBS98_08785 [Chitinophagia bacterium]|nr:hypothetical protein [Chitinophagia bacterium]